MSPMQFIVSQLAPDRPVLYRPKPMRPESHQSNRKPLNAIPTSTEDIAKMRADGVPWKDLEARTGMTSAGLTYRLRRDGLHAPRMTTVTDKELRKAAQMRAEGKTWSEIAKALGRSKAGIYNAYRTKGLA